MNMGFAPQSSILEHLDKLLPAREKGKYQCPVCNGQNLSADSKTGKLKCWDGCDSKQVYAAIVPPREKTESSKVPPDRTVHKKARTLTEDHRNHLRSEGFSDAHIDLWMIEGLCSLTEKEARDRSLVCKADNGKLESSSGLWFPEGSGQLRCDNPPIRNGKPAKYLTPYGATGRAHLPSNCEVITEGAKDGRAGTVHGGIPTGWMAGVSHYRKALPKGSKLTILFDSDGWYNPSVFTQLCHAAKHTGGKVQLIPAIPGEPKAGLCEYFKAGYKAWHYRQLIDSAMPIADFLFELPKHWAELNEDQRQKCIRSLISLAAQYLDESGRDRLISHMSSLLKVGKRPLQGILKTFIRKLQAKARKEQTEKRKEQVEDATKTVDGMSLGQVVQRKLYAEDRWICVANKLYKWVGTHYEQSPDESELIRIKQLADSYYLLDEKYNPYFPFAEISKVRSALDWVKTGFAVQPELCNPPGINCTNGVLQIDYDDREMPKFELVPHTPDLYYLYEPKAKYDPDAPSEDCDRLLNALEAPQQEVLLKVLAASMDLKNVRKRHGRDAKALLTIGDGSNGKDSIREVVSTIFGGTGLASVNLKAFEQYDEGRQFPLASLTTARVNWASENPSGIAIDRLQSLKAAISGDPLKLELKGKDEREFEPNCIHLFNLNEAPSLKGASNAIKSRFAIVEFNRVYKKNADPMKGEMEVDPRFKYDRDFLQNNVIPAFVNRLISAFKDLMQNGFNYECCEEAMQGIRIQNSHLLEFAADVGLVTERGSVVPIKELWQALEAYYVETDVLTIDDSGRRSWADPVRPGDQYVKGSNQVANRIMKLFPGCKLVDAGHRVKGIKGLAIAPISSSAEEITNEVVEAEESDLQPQVKQSKEPEAIPEWVRVGGCAIHKLSGEMIRITEIVSSPDRLMLKIPTGELIPLADCEHEQIPPNIKQRAA